MEDIFEVNGQEYLAVPIKRDRAHDFFYSGASVRSRNMIFTDHSRASDEVSTVTSEAIAQLKSLQLAEAKIKARQHEIYAKLSDSIENSFDDDLQLNASTYNDRYIKAEVSSALNISEWSVANMMSKSSNMLKRFPQTLKSFSSGEITSGHVFVMIEAAQHLLEGFGLYETQGVEICKMMTPGRSKEHLKILAEEIIAETQTGVPFSQRHEAELLKRDVFIKHFDNGMSQVSALLDSVTAEAIKNRLDKYVKAVKSKVEQRQKQVTDQESVESIESRNTFTKRLTGEIRADIFADLLLTGDPTEEATAGEVTERIKATVRVTIPASDLADNGSQKASFGYATMPGCGPVDLKMAKRLASGATAWERVFQHPKTGIITQVDSYRPTKAMRRFLAIRDEHCRFPGCRAKPEKSDIDHTIDWQHNGKTTLTNLAHLCRRHHVLKHLKFIDGTRWKVKQDATGGLTWVSPLGYEHVEIPGSRVRFEKIPEQSERSAQSEPPTVPAPF